MSAKVQTPAHNESPQEEDHMKMENEAAAVKAAEYPVENEAAAVKAAEYPVENEAAPADETAAPAAAAVKASEYPAEDEAAALEAAAKATEDPFEAVAEAEAKFKTEAEPEFKTEAEPELKTEAEPELKREIAPETAAAAEADGYHELDEPMEGTTDAEERLALARAKAAAAKSAVADRRASHRSTGADSELSDGAEGRRRSSSGQARRGSIRSVLESVEDAEAAMRAMDAEEQAMDERLQVYSEVVGLRKELRVVREDADRTRAQLQQLQTAATMDVPSAATLAAAEEAAERSAVQHEWTAACRRFPCGPDDAAAWSKVRVEDLHERLAAAEAKFRDADKAAAKLQAEQEAEINANTDARDRAKAELNASVEEEMTKLAETQARLKQMEREQWFHIKRGTHVKQRQTPARVRQENTKHRAYESEAKEVGNVVQLTNERTELTEQVRQFRRALEDNKRSYNEEQQKLQQQLEAAEENGKDAREMRELFEKENEDLREVKHDLQRVLQYVRVRNREGIE